MNWVKSSRQQPAPMLFVHWQECTERSQEKTDVCLQSPGGVWYWTPPQFCTTLTRWLTHRSHDVTPGKWFWWSLFYYTVKWVYRVPLPPMSHHCIRYWLKGVMKSGEIVGEVVIRLCVCSELPSDQKHGVMCFSGKWKDGFFLGFNRTCLNGNMSGCSFLSSQSEVCKEKYVPCTWNSFHSVECN